jgi:hypothetical protein
VTEPETRVTARRVSAAERVRSTNHLANPTVSTKSRFLALGIVAGNEFSFIGK